MEFTANALSPEMKPIIVATSPTSIATFPPGGTLGRDWLVAARIGHGAGGPSVKGADGRRELLVERR